jgi:capsular polysaccharide transport system permease protein
MPPLSNNPATGRPIDRAPSFVESAGIQLRVLNALIIRFLMTRYGRQNIGFVWVVLEPMLLSGGVMLLWSISKPPYEHGVPVVAIVLTGYLPLTLWRHITSGSVHILRHNLGLLYHRNVTMLDAIMARIALEFIGTTCAFIIVYAILLVLHVVDPIYDLGLLLAGWFLMGALSFGFGCILAAVTEYSEVVEKFVQPVQYLMVPLSGCFFMVEWLPAKAQQLIVWFPLVHAYEAFRAGFFGPSVVTHQSITYGAAWAFATTCLGLWLIEQVRDRVQKH